MFLLLEMGLVLSVSNQQNRVREKEEDGCSKEKENPDGGADHSVIGS